MNPPTSQPAEASSDSPPPKASAARRWATAALVAVLLVAGAAVLWDTVLRDRIFPRRFGVVVPGSIYRAAQLEANIVDGVIVDHGVRHVINLGVYKPGKPRHDATLAAIDHVDATHIELGLGGDGTGDPDAYIEALTDMRRAAQSGEPVLVHCSAGVNRTGGAVALYRVFFEDWDTARAVAEMKSYDFDPEENRTLLPYLDEHYRHVAQGLVRRGLLDEVPELSQSFIEANTTAK